MIEAMKIAAKIALIGAITAGIIAIITLIEVPMPDYSILTDALGTAKAIVYHWCPGAEIVIRAAISLMGVYIVVFAFQLGALAWRWIFKVNE